MDVENTTLMRVCEIQREEMRREGKKSENGHHRPSREKPVYGNPLTSLVSRCVSTAGAGPS